jgi:P4 family phage/plasmid primase-like protien
VDGTPSEITQFSATSQSKLGRSGLDEDFVRTMGVRPVATAADLPLEFQGLNYAPTPGMLFPWSDGDTTVWQYRPDTPVEEGLKYVFAEGCHQPLGLVRRAERTPRRFAIVEGTLQSLVMARYAPDDVEVYAIPGCWGWSHEGMPASGLGVVDGADVYVFLDADAGTNADVYTAGIELEKALRARGAADVWFARVPVRGTNGVDDFLGGSVPEDGRADAVAALLEGAKRKPADTKPKGKARRPDVELLPTNDTWLATTWADQNRDVFRWLADDEGWMRFRLGRWEETGASVVGSSVGLFLDGVARGYEEAKDEDEVKSLLSNVKISNVLGRASRYQEIHVQRTQLDQHPRLWNAGNCVIDLETGQIREHDPALMLTTGSDVPYAPDATAPRFDEFFADILPDAEVRAFLLRLFGVAMFGEVRGNAQIFPVLIGEGRNGKGALVRIMEKLFGRHAVKVSASALLERKFEAHSQEVIKLRGKRLATAEETTQNARWDTARIKSWTGGDTLVGRFMQQNDEEFVPSHTLLMSTNHRPNVSMDESAFWMRYREVPFTVSVEGREDPTLEPHIIGSELPGVLNHLLAGARDYLSRGLEAPAAVLVATEEARAETNRLAIFAEEMLVVTNDDRDRVPHAEMRERADKWWTQNVRNEPLPSDRGRGKFTPLLRSALGLVEGATKNPRPAGQGSDQRTTWFGVRWLGDGGGGPRGTAPLLPLNKAVTPVPAPAPAEGHEKVTTTPDGALPQTETGSAPTTTPSNDLDDDNIAGREVVSKSSASSALKKKHVSHRENDEEGYLNGTETHTHVGGTSTDRAIGQKAPHEAAPAALGDPVVFDLETADAEQLYDHPNPREFVRIAGRTTPDGVVVDAGPDAVIEAVLSSHRVIGHNIVHFDLPALARVDGRVDLLTLTRDRRVLDTMITESVLHPILNDKSAGAVAKAAKYFKLGAVCERRGIPGKVDEIDRLAKLHGGYDAIPVDDLDYRTYCAGDVGAERVLAGLQAAEIAALPRVQQDYLWREHRVHAIAATMGAQGFLVDQPLLQRRFWHGYGRKNDLSRSLIARYGIPTTKADGKPADSPAATKGGKEAILAAFASLGVDVDAMERTAKGAIAFGKVPMETLIETYEDHPRAEEIAVLAGMVADVNGVRTVYGTALEYLRADGRVHPEVVTFQASGRWSVRKPGLTVYGKREGRSIERAVFRAAEGHALFAIDLSQIDARAIAVHSQDHAYLDLFLPGRDAHEIVARMVWGDSVYDSDRKRYRQEIKAITHGLPYGMGVPKLAAHAKVSEELAQRVVDTMNERFPRLQAWKEEVREQASAGYPLDNGFGRVMLADPDRAYTQAPALMGQGTARDLMMQALLNLPDFAVRMLRAQVHDEAVFEIPLALANEIVPRIERAFNFEWAPPGASRTVQIVADAGKLGQSWAECY